MISLSEINFKFKKVISLKGKELKLYPKIKIQTCHMIYFAYWCKTLIQIEQCLAFDFDFDNTS